MRPLFVMVLAAALAACATLPEPLRAPAVSPLTLAQARAQASPPNGARVRWGGRIEKVTNKPEETWVEIVERPLDDAGRPEPSDQSGGRFIARVDGFLDPAVYAKGRDMTVLGVVDGRISGRVGDYPYEFIAVKAQGYVLWPKRVHRARAYPYPYGDPFYDPFWPGPYWGSPWYPWGPYGLYPP